MLEISLLLTVFLVSLAAFTSVEYYKKIKKAQEKYLEAKDVISDVIISFNRQLEMQEKKLGLISREVEAKSFNSRNLEDKVVFCLKNLDELRARLDFLEKSKDKSDFKDELTSKIEGLSKKILEIEEAQAKLLEKIRKIEDTEKTPVKLKRRSLAAPIPLKREEALSRLTETELKVLEILADEGEKTAPEIRNRINLTREHTARLMKKLYEEGYLERRTDKVPFTYRLKEEMRGLMRKPREAN